nr:hypothetical protein [Armatimonas sp.]
MNPMGDKSPKSVNKKAGQKQGKVDVEKQKRDAADAARQAATTPTKK